MTGDLTTNVIVSWLRPLVTSGARVFSGRLPETPNRCIGIEMLPGPGLEMEDLFDVVAFQVRSRGGENNLDDAEEIALEVDRICTGRDPRVTTENFMLPTKDGVGVYVSRMGRTGGRPGQLTIADPNSRYNFTCTYFIEASTNIGLTA